MSIFEGPYEQLRAEASRDLKGPEVSHLLTRLVRLGIDFLVQRCDQIDVKSAVADKHYVVFRLKRRGDRFSRPVNKELFDAGATLGLLDRVAAGRLSGINQTRRARALYSSVMSYCCANDLLKQDDRKTPATFFEMFVGHLVAGAYGTNPKTQIEVLARPPGVRRSPRTSTRVESSSQPNKLQERPRLPDLTQRGVQAALTLPTDFVFDLGPDKSRIHLPIKLSTRERIIQVWAHQRVLDGVYGINAFRALLVCLTETNMVRRTMSVVEVCLPEQWAIYQMFISQLYRIYYFDPPAPYLPLAERYPYIQVKSFAAFFDESEGLVIGPPAV